MATLKETTDAILLEKQAKVTADNLVDGISAFGVTGTMAIYTEPTYQSKNIIPTIETQIVTADDNYNGLSEIVVEAVTSSIDENIIADNIRKDIDILNVRGTLVEGVDTSDATASAEDIAEGKVAYVNGERIIGTLTKATGGKFPLPSKVTFNNYQGDFDGSIFDITGLTNNFYMMFANSGIVNLDLSTWADIGVTNLYSAFQGSKNLINLYIPNLECQNLKSMAYWLAGTGNISNLDCISTWKNIPTNLNIGSLYAGAGITTINNQMFEWFSNVNLSQTTTSDWFAGCSKLENVNLSGLNIPNNLKVFQSWFSSCSRLQTFSMTNMTHQANLMCSMFYGCSNLQTVNFSGWNNPISSGLNFCNMFNGCTNLHTVDFTNTNLSTAQASIDYTLTFHNCRNLQNIYGSLRQTNNGTFMNCYQLKSVNIDKPGMYMNNTFRNCRNMTDMNFLTENIYMTRQINAQNAFCDCWALTNVNFGGWNIIYNYGGTNFQNMFYNCSNLRNLNVTNVNITYLNGPGMFTNCLNLSTESLLSITHMLMNSVKAISTLANFGLTQDQTNTIMSLETWSTLESLGWTTGY